MMGEQVLCRPRERGRREGDMSITPNANFNEKELSAGSASTPEPRHDGKTRMMGVLNRKSTRLNSSH